MLELKQYLDFLKRWTWLILIGVILGVIAGYIFSQYQTPVYQAATKVLIMRAPEETSSLLSSPSDQQLAQTFTGLLVTRPILDATSQQLGYQIKAGQIEVVRNNDAQLILVNVEDKDPAQAAEIANTLVDIFIKQYNQLQTDRFASSEESLQAQLQQVEEQINTLQAQFSKMSGQNLDDQTQTVTSTIANLQAEILELQQQIVNLEYDRNPMEVYDNRSHIMIIVTPTPSIEQRVDIVIKEDRLQELQTLLGMYQRIYVDLSISGGISSEGTSRSVDQIQEALSLYRQIYSTLLSNYEAIRLARLKSTPNIVQVEEATPPISPIRPRLLTNVILGGSLGLIVFGGIALLIEFLDDTFRTPEEISSVLQLPIMGFIGEMRRSWSLQGQKNIPYVLKNPRSPVAEAFRSLRTNLQFTELDKPLKTLLVSSPDVSEGKTTVAINLAIALAQSGKRVLLMDADLRRPHVHKALDLPNRVGLSDVFRKQIAVTNVIQSCDVKDLAVITSGTLPPNPAEVLSSEKMVNILSAASEISEMTIIDAPPLILADASVLSARVDGVLIVIQLNHTHATPTRNVLDQLERVGARILGVVINRVRQKDTKFYYRHFKDYASFSYDVEPETSSREG